MTNPTYKSIFTFCILSFFLSYGFSQPNLTFPIDIPQGILDGDIKRTHTTIDEGSIDNIFNGAQNDWARSADINPMVITLEFNYPINITATSMYSHYNESGVWTVEIANSLTEMNTQSGAYQKLVDQAAYTPYTTISQTINGSGKVLRLTVLKQSGDNYVHLSEWGITATANISLTSICMKPNQVRLIKNAQFQPRFYGADADGNTFVLPSAVTLNSSNTNVVAVDTSGVFSSFGNLGESTISASWNGLDLQTTVKVVDDFVSPTAEKRVAKVALIFIDPQIPAAGGQRFSERFWSYVGVPMQMAETVRDSMNSITGGAIEYQFAEIHQETDLSLNSFGGSELSVDSMYQLFLEPGWATLRSVGQQGQSIFLYNDMLNKYNLCEKSNNHEIDEVWVYAMPFIGMWESNMTGTDAFWINGAVVRDNSCVDLLPIMGFNYERAVGCALHNFTHRIETTMYKVFDTSVRYGPSSPPYPTGSPSDNLQLFMNYDLLEPGNAHIGNGHYPPNGVQDYDYGNQNSVISYSPNWKRFPFIFNDTKMINCSEWGCEGDCGLNFCSWWMRHIPHYKCADQGGVLNNWWSYILDYNEGKALEAQIDNCDCTMFDDDVVVNCDSKGEFPWEDWISRVKVHDLDNPSGKSQYSDFSAEVLNIRPGGSYSLSLSAGFSYFTYDEYVRVWLDWNKDGIFQDVEKIAEGILQKPADGTPEATLDLPNFLSIPFGVDSILNMKMRVSMKRGSYPTACETFSFGEVEDYTVNLEAAPSNDPNLSLSNWIAPSSATPDQSQDGRFDLLNSGIPPVLSGFSVGVFLSTDNLWAPNDILIGTKTYPPSTIGAFANEMINYTVPANAATGAYYLIVKVDYTDAIMEMSESDNTAVLPFSVQQMGAYCPSQGDFPWEDWISKVKIANVDKNSGKSQYSDFTSDIIEVHAGSPVDIVLGTGYSYYTYDEYWKVWIDYNQNGVFEEPTEIYTSLIAPKPLDGTAYSEISTSAFITGGFTSDFTTRMRVAMKRGDFPSPCESFAYGEVEDYSIHINTAATGADLELTLTADKTTVPLYGTVQLSYQVKNTGDLPVSSAEIFTGICPTNSDTYFSSNSGYVYAGVPAAPSLGTYNYVTQNWVIADLAPGQIGNLTIDIFSLTNAERSVIAYCTAQSPNDPDSQPNSSLPNCVPTQDDEAVWTLNLGQNKLQEGIKREAVYETPAFSIFPNPATQQVFIDLKKWEGRSATVSMYNQLGVKVLEKRFESVSTAPEALDLSNIPNGSYFFKIETEGERAVFGKLIVDKGF